MHPPATAGHMSKQDATTPDRSGAERSIAEPAIPGSADSFCKPGTECLDYVVSRRFVRGHNECVVGQRLSRARNALNNAEGLRRLS